ncbi:hypothetical protein MADA3029_620014 [Vibrio nigripulchritudo MADA3029]|nr:hypothetical protein VIBNIMADA3021_180014 [Vibrio nigripulchritudo MADA3021]CCN60660.1 hypothetical protein MADA3029_620014 [Vibrio nigripulchritudo MADA3029]
MRGTTAKLKLMLKKRASAEEKYSETLSYHHFQISKGFRRRNSNY